MDRTLKALETFSTIVTAEKTMTEAMLDDTYKRMSNVIDDLFNIAFSSFENEIDKEELRSHLIVDIKEMNKIDNNLSYFDIRRGSR